MAKLKYCFTAYGLFQTLLDVNPMMTGCYQWIRAFDGVAKNYKTLLQEDLEKYDVIMTNLDGYDWRIVLDLKHRLRGSSTKVVANQDYSPETYNDSFEHIQDFSRAIIEADHTFATTPAAQDSMQILAGDEQKVWMIPHPCETHVIKHLKSVFKNEACAVFFHRYNGGDTVTPWIIMKDLGITTLLAGYMKSYDKWHRRTNSIYQQIVDYMKYPDFLKFMAEISYGLFVPNSWTYGRIPCDAACMGLPMVCSSSVYSANVLYPLTSVNPMDYRAAREKMMRLKRDDGFYQEVSDLAKYNSEYFGHKRSRERFMEMLESKK